MYVSNGIRILERGFRYHIFSVPALGTPEHLDFGAAGRLFSLLMAFRLVCRARL